MKASKNAHCLIKVDGRDRRLFAMVERPKLLDLTISFRTMDVMGEGYGKEHEGKRIKLQKYSVHPSPDSATRINAIKHTVELENGTVFTGEHYTQALKQHAKFAYIPSVWCPDLGQEKYAYNKRPIQKVGSWFIRSHFDDVAIQHLCRTAPSGIHSGRECGF